MNSLFIVHDTDDSLIGSPSNSTLHNRACFVAQYSLNELTLKSDIILSFLAMAWKSLLVEYLSCASL